MNSEEQEKIERKVMELLRKSFLMDEITEKRQNPMWSILCYLLNKYIQETKGDIVIQMRYGHVLGPYMKWNPDDAELEEAKRLDN